MTLSNQKQVLVGLDVLAARALRKARREYDATTLEALRRTIATAVTAEQALRWMNSSQVRQMETEPLARAIEQTAINAALIGRVATTRRKRRTGTRANRNGRAG